MAQTMMALRAVSGRASGIVRIANGVAVFSLKSVSAGRAHILFADGRTAAQELTRTISGATARVAVNRSRILGAAVTNGERVILIGAGGGPLNAVLERAKQIAMSEKAGLVAPTQEEETKTEVLALPEEIPESTEEGESTQEEESEEERAEHAAAIAKLALLQGQAAFAEKTERKETELSAGLFVNAFPKTYPRVNWQIVERTDGVRLLRTAHMGKRLLAYPSAPMVVPPAGLPGNARYAVARSGQGYWVMEE